MASYPKTAVNTVKRMPKQGEYDYATVHNIINTCPVLHVSFNDPSHPFPVVLPMIGCTGDFSNQNADPESSPQDIYIHGYVSSRMFKSSDGDEGVPMTVAATHMDGLVLALTPYHNSCNYRSALAYGYGTLVTDEAERLYAMERITDSLLPTRWTNSRTPPTKVELQSTAILRIKVSSASAKVRVGGPNEDRNDEKDAELRGRVWTGVVPCWLQWGEPMPSQGNGVEEVEGYIEKWRVGENGKGRVGAFEAVGKDCSEG